jgi:hypothetical protein
VPFPDGPDAFEHLSSPVTMAQRVRRDLWVFANLCREAEAALRGRRPDEESTKEALDAIARDIAPIDDVRSTARYRLRVARNLLAEFLSGVRVP